MDEEEVFDFSGFSDSPPAYAVVADIGDEIVGLDAGYDSLAEATKCFEYFSDEAATKAELEARGVSAAPKAVYLTMVGGGGLIIEESKEF